MQLDIFDHSRDLMLRNDVLDALQRRDAAAARSARQALQAEYPEDPHLPALAVLGEALQPPAPGPGHAAVQAERQRIADTLEPAARQMFGAAAGRAWTLPLWRELARQAAPLPWLAEHADAHAAALWLLAGDWQAAADATAGIESWRRIPTPLAWMAQARWHLLGLKAAWPLLAELAWLAPARFDALTRQVADPVFDGLRRQFELAFDGPTGGPADLAWLPAWVLTAKPELAPVLASAQASRQLAPERALRLMVELLGLEHQGRHHDLVQRRQQLRDTQAALYAAYMKTR